MSDCDSDTNYYSGQKGHYDLELSPLAPINGANGDPLVPMVMNLMEPKVHPIAIGTNGDHHWCQWRSPLVIIGSNKMDPLAPFSGDVTSTTANDSQWHQ